MKKSKRIKLIILAIVIIAVALVLLFPGSRMFIGAKLSIDMRVRVNGESIVPYNITCTDGAGNVEKVRVVSKDDGLVLYIGAFHHDMYTISYDVDTSDGVKHFTYGIMRTKQGGPRDNLWYYMDLDENEEIKEWEARVWLDWENTESKAHTIILSDDENAYVQFGP